MANSYLIWCVKSLQRYAVLDTAIDSISTDNGARPLVEAIRCFRALQIGAWNGLSFRLNVCTYICIYIYICVCVRMRDIEYYTRTFEAGIRYFRAPRI